MALYVDVIPDRARVDAGIRPGQADGGALAKHDRHVAEGCAGRVRTVADQRPEEGGRRSVEPLRNGQVDHGDGVAVDPDLEAQVRRKIGAETVAGRHPDANDRTGPSLIHQDEFIAFLAQVAIPPTGSEQMVITAGKRSGQHLAGRVVDAGVRTGAGILDDRVIIAVRGQRHWRRPHPPRWQRFADIRACCRTDRDEKGSGNRHGVQPVRTSAATMPVLSSKTCSGMSSSPFETTTAAVRSPVTLSTVRDISRK